MIELLSCTENFGNTGFSGITDIWAIPKLIFFIKKSPKYQIFGSNESTSVLGMGLEGVEKAPFLAQVQQDVGV